ncbi:hypothetical protein NMG60_11013647 [Bertholletia excelsa]
MAGAGGMGMLVVASFLVVSWVPTSHCSKKPAGLARKEDIPYIKCQVCQQLAKQLYQQVEAQQAQISPKKISEYKIIEISENICNLKKQEADWILKIDILEQEDKLELVEQDSEGQCNSECKTIERACQEVMGYSDTDVAEYMDTNKPQIDSLMHFLFKDLSKACNAPPPPVPKDRTPGELFVPKSSKEAEMEKMLKSVESMPGTPSMKINFGDEDADEDDDNDDTEFPSKLGKVLKEKQSKMSNWKQKMTQQLPTRGKIRQWWKRTKASLKKSKSGKQEL